MTSTKSGRHSLFLRDIASPISGHRSAASRFATSAISSADLPPPPPAFTLDDHGVLSPEFDLVSSPNLLPPSPNTPAPPQRSPFSFVWPSLAPSDGSVPTAVDGGARYSPESSSLWLHGVRGSDEKVKEGAASPGSSITGVVHSGALITLPPPREVARPEVQLGSSLGVDFDEDERWVTVYGFAPADTNLVLCEFEKCGLILKQIPGAGGANWIHILYQSRHEAQRSLQKNGLLLNNALIVGVRPLDQIQRRYLSETTFNGPRGGSSTPVRVGPYLSPYRQQLGPETAMSASRANGGGRRSAAETIASPAKSFISKAMDLMFGI